MSNTDFTHEYVVRKFIEIEKRLNLLNQSEDALIWERMRHIVIDNTFLKIGMHESKRKMEIGKLKNMKKFYILILLMYNSLLYNPFFVWKKPKYLFWGSPRRKKENNYYVDIYTDYLSELLPKEKVMTVEKPYNWSHLTPAFTKKLKYADFFLLCTFILKRLYVKKNNIYVGNIFKKVEIELYQEFGVNLPIHKLAVSTAVSRKIALLIFKTYLKWIRPEIIFLVSSYGKANLIEAAQKQNIVTVELQHGVLSPTHLGYSFPKPLKKKCFPDYFFSFGIYWSQHVNFPIEYEKIIPIGFPYLNSKVQSIGKIEKKDQILFLSQSTSGSQVIQCAIMLAHSSSRPKSIIFKLHPDEYRWWKKEYPDLLKAEKQGLLQVVDKDNPGLYELLAESEYQVGVNSTAIYEGIAFGCRTIIVKINGHEYMRDLIDSGSAILLEPEKFHLHYSDAPQLKREINDIFHGQWEKSFLSAVKKIEENKN